MLTHNVTSWKHKIALITGASSGIGAAIARKLAHGGMKVILVARREAQLQQLADEILLAGGDADVISADLSSSVEREQVFAQVDETYRNIDVLVNNAGLGWYGYGIDMPWKTASTILQVNIEAAVHFSLLFLKKMRLLGSGHIINIGSISGSLPSQGVAVYGATKSFLDNFSTALYRELVGTRLHVSVVRAGPVMTEFCETAASLDGGMHVPTEHFGVSAEAVAERVWKLIQHPRRVVYIPSWLAITPYVENTFGWIIDLVGPLLLRRQSHQHKTIKPAVKSKKHGLTN